MLACRYCLSILFPLPRLPFKCSLLIWIKRSVTVYFIIRAIFRHPECIYAATANELFCLIFCQPHCIKKNGRNGQVRQMSGCCAGKTKERRGRKKNVIPVWCERALVLEPAGLNLKKLSGRHLKVFNPTEFYRELSAEMQKKTCVVHLPDLR